MKRICKQFLVLSLCVVMGTCTGLTGAFISNASDYPTVNEENIEGDAEGYGLGGSVNADVEVEGNEAVDDESVDDESVDDAEGLDEIAVEADASSSDASSDEIEIFDNNSGDELFDSQEGILIKDADATLEDGDASFDADFPTSGNCGSTAKDNVTWKYEADTKTLRISGKGAIADYDKKEDAPWYKINDKIYHLVIEDGVTRIGNRNFNDIRYTIVDSVYRGHCDIKLGTTIKSIGTYAFEDSYFTGDLVIPESVTSIASYAFYDLFLYGNLYINAKVKVLEENSFGDLELHGEITLPDTVEEIKAEAFGFSYGIRYLTFPKSLKKIGWNAFEVNTQLKRVVFLGNAPEVEDEAFRTLRVACYYPAGNSTWTEDVRKKIGKTFVGVTWYKSGEKKSSKCGDNITWSVDNGVLTISGSGAMWDYTKKTVCPWHDEEIKKVVVSDGITRIGGYAFAEFSKKMEEDVAFTSIPESVVEFGDGAFYSFGRFRNFNLPSKVKYIGNYAFSDVFDVRSNIEIPADIEYIGDNAFSTFTINQGGMNINGFNKVKYIGNNAFYLGVYTKGCTVHGKLTLPETLTYIGDNAFRKSKLEGTIKLPSKLTYLGGGAFRECENLGGAVVVPDAVKEIKDDTFYGTKITSVTLGKYLTSVGRNAFYNCTELTTVKFMGDFVEGGKFCSSNSFAGCRTGIIVMYNGNRKSWKSVSAAMLGMAGLDPVFKPFYEPVEPDDPTDPVVPDDPEDWGDVSSAVRKYMGFKSPSQVPAGMWLLGSDKYEGQKFVYDGKAKKLDSLLVFSGKKLLVKGKDYTEKYSANVNAGTAKVTLTFKGTFAKVKPTNYYFTISPISVSYLTLSDTRFFFTYDGKVHKPKPTATYNDNGKTITLKAGKDFGYDYASGDFKSCGSSFFYVRPMGNYNFTAVKAEVVITNQIVISKATVAKIPAQKYTGSSIKPVVSLKYNGKVLEPGKDYAVFYGENIDVGKGKGTITISGSGKFMGKRVVSFDIVGTPLSKTKFTGNMRAEEYIGGPVTKVFNITYTEKKGAEPVTLKGVAGENYDNAPRAYARGYDYIYRYENNVNKGTAKLVIVGIGGYTGKITKTFKITAYKIDQYKTKFDARIPQNSYVYNNKPVQPKVTVYFKCSIHPYDVLVEKKDFTVTYVNCNKKGNARVKITGKGNFTGTMYLDYTIH